MNLSKILPCSTNNNEKGMQIIEKVNITHIIFIVHVYLKNVFKIISAIDSFFPVYFKDKVDNSIKIIKAFLNTFQQLSLFNCYKFVETF